MKAETIDHSTLSKLVDAGAVRGAHVIGQNGGWSVLVQYGKVERPLVSERSQNVRLFKRFETLVSYLRKIGIVKFNVDTLEYDSTATSNTKRPDRSEALRKAHEAAAYDKWFREKVQESIDDPRPSIPHEEVEAHFAERRARLMELAK